MKNCVFIEKAHVNQWEDDFSSKIIRYVAWFIFLARLELCCKKICIHISRLLLLGRNCSVYFMFQRVSCNRNPVIVSVSDFVVFSTYSNQIFRKVTRMRLRECTPRWKSDRNNAGIQRNRPVSRRFWRYEWSTEMSAYHFTYCARLCKL